MIDLSKLRCDMKEIEFRPKRPDVYKILVPFFYEDGDMYDIFLEISPIDPTKLRITDRGLTIMKLSYVFDFNTSVRREVLNSLLSQNRVGFEDGEIFLDTGAELFQQSLYQMLQTLAKVSNVDILNRETVKSMFYEMFKGFVAESLNRFDVTDAYVPLPNDKNLTVDYKIEAHRPIFLYPVKDNAKASKVIISCLNFQQKNVPFRSLIVHENFEKLDGFNKKQITNISDKQFYTLDDFERDGSAYIERELSA